MTNALPLPAPRIRILAAEDGDIERRILKALFAGSQYDLVLARDGADAVLAFQRDRPDLVLMDLGLPVMDGYEATRLIKQESQGRYVPVILLTASTDEALLQRGLAVGADDYVLKPFNKTLLLSKIAAALRVRELFERVREQTNELLKHQRRDYEERRVAERIFSAVLSGGCLGAPYIRHLLSPMAIFNGDLVLAAQTPDGAVRLLVGDFAGHGLSAAVGALPLAEIFTSRTEAGVPLQEVVRQLHQKLRAVMPVGLFCSAVLLELDAARKRLFCWNGGLPDVLVRDDGGLRARLPSRHVPLGVGELDAHGTDLDLLEVGAGDRIFSYSDGVTEMASPAGELFGAERLQALLAAPGPGEPVFHAVRAALGRFRGRGPQTDDVTLVELRVDPPAALAPAIRASTAAVERERTDTPALQLSAMLGPDALRRGDLVPRFCDSLTVAPHLQARRTEIYAILAELVNNALEHGVLRLDSSLKCAEGGFARYYALRGERLAALQDGFVRIEATLFVQPRPELWLCVEDSGAGFSLERGAHDGEQPHGMGLELVRGLCTALRTVPERARIEAVFRP